MTNLVSFGIDKCSNKKFAYKYHLNNYKYNFSTIGSSIITNNKIINIFGNDIDNFKPLIEIDKNGKIIYAKKIYFNNYYLEHGQGSQICKINNNKYGVLISNKPNLSDTSFNLIILIDSNFNLINYKKVYNINMGNSTGFGLYFMNNKLILSHGPVSYSEIDTNLNNIESFTFSYNDVNIGGAVACQLNDSIFYYEGTTFFDLKNRHIILTSNQPLVINNSCISKKSNTIFLFGGSENSSKLSTIIKINPINFSYSSFINRIEKKIVYRLDAGCLTNFENAIISISQGSDLPGRYPIITKSSIVEPFFCNTENGTLIFPKPYFISSIIDNSYALSNSNINIRVEDYMPEITVTPLSFRLRTICTNEEPFSGIGVNIGKDSVVICNDTSYTITTYNPTQNSKFYWNTGDTTRKITVKKTGVYKLRTVKGQCENIDSLKVIFANVKLPHFTNDSTLCIGQSVIIDATKGQLYNPIYKWNDNSNIGKRTITKKGNYTLSIKNSYSCKDTFRIKINYHDSLKAEIMKDTLICKGAQAKLHIDISGGIESKQTAQWFDDMNKLIGTGKIVFKNFINSTKVKAVVTDSCTSYQITKYVNINVRPPLKISYLRDTAICLGQSVELFTDGSGGDSSAYNFEWNNNLGTGKSKIVIPSKTTKYIVVLKDNCTFKFDTAECIISIPTVRAIAKANPMITTIENPFVVFENLSTPSVLNEWNWGNGSSTITASREKIEIIYGDTGVYVVSLKIKSPYGCFDDTTLKIRIKDIFRFYVPNAFTPDGNSLNECFEFKTRGVKKFKFIVYNSWGEKIFESTNPLDGWSGNELPMGIYFYTAEVYDQDFILHNYKGIIHLIR